MDNRHCDEYSYLVKGKVTLKNKDLWKKFHELGTEMIITKSGRRMFPSMAVQLSNLDPDVDYCVMLEMSCASHCRYKYSSGGGWTPAGAQDAQSPRRVYVHPESPAKGDYWMAQAVSFGRMKLTNTAAPPAGQVILSSMHKYQPRIIIAETSDPRALEWAPTSYFMFPETQFIAVTAYQNERITKLKIDNNPFAKGFRENGQSKCKRKRPTSDEDIQTDCERSTVETTKTKKEENSLTERNNNNNVRHSFPSPTEIFHPVYFPYVSQILCYENCCRRLEKNYINCLASVTQNSVQNQNKINNVKSNRVTDFSVRSLLGYT